MSPYIIFDSNERQQTKCLPKNNTLKCQCPATGLKGHGSLNVCEKKEDSRTWNARPAKLYYLAFHGRPGGLKFFSFFGGFKINETSQRVRVGRKSQCMGCIDVFSHYLLNWRHYNYCIFIIFILNFFDLKPITK